VEVPVVVPLFGSTASQLEPHFSLGLTVGVAVKASGVATKGTGIETAAVVRAAAIAPGVVTPMVWFGKAKLLGVSAC